MKFDTGNCYATPGALDAIERAGVSFAELLGRHVRGDWGDLGNEDRAANIQALRHGSRIFSAYHLKSGARVWVITEAVSDDGQRASTTLMLPADY
ncbi:hypothetical protein [Variovorax sp. LG9.2]|uniref:hypothetical protein n=1 Tax=Variovorax sp. LG9.2 TaxID=3048626 RepID=UPI002B234E09|nr:hypothetical protein [Variovorax sp. LG9.2]MEB0056724.1 hypothetical protein [Variovorax sp. LG9.2]